MQFFRADDPVFIAQELGSEFTSRFEILGVLGQGGMGVVLRVVQRDLNREVAVKLMLHSEPEQRKRFQREGRLLAKLRHPNLVAVLAIGEASNSPYLVFELVEGETLRAHLDRQGALPIETGVGLVKQVAEGLAAAHEQGILHRDVKCSNIMITPEGIPKLGDFGLALSLESRERITRTGIFMGTPEYTAPEVIRGEMPQPASDLYSLGMVLYEVLAGNTSFGNLPLQELMKAHLSKEAPLLRTLRPEVPGWVEYVCRRLLSKEPARRFQSAAALARLLGDGLDGKPNVIDLAVARDPGKRSGRFDVEATLPGARPVRPTRERILPASKSLERPTRRPVSLALGGSAAVLALVLGLAGALRHAPPGAAGLKPSFEPGQTAISASWLAPGRQGSWLEVAGSGAAAVWRRGQDLAGAGSAERSDSIGGLQPGTSYRARVACADGSSSLEQTVSTLPLERPTIKLEQGGAAVLELVTREPLLGRLDFGGRTGGESGEPRQLHHFPLEGPELLLGLQKAHYVCRSAGGARDALELPPVPSITREMLAGIDSSALAELLGDLYRTPAKRTTADVARIFGRVRQMRFYPSFSAFAPLAADFFSKLPGISLERKTEVYNGLLKLECLDAAAKDFQVAPPIAFAKLTESFIPRYYFHPPFEPRFHWSSDYDLKKDNYWVSEGHSRLHSVIRAGTRQFTDTCRTRRVFHLIVPRAELEAAKRVAIEVRVSTLVMRSFFNLELNGQLRLAVRTFQGWDGNVIGTDTAVGSIIPPRFLHAGDNELEVTMDDLPGVQPMTTAVLWGIEAIGE